ncbi:putative RNA-directed DNA polymerase [Tanacetum coccineum]
MILVIVILRIIVGWDSNCVDVMVMEQMDQVVHCFVKPLNGDKSFHCSFIYAYSHTTYRRSLWKSLKKYKRAITNEPWIVFGDFNASFHPFEKSTGGSMITTSMSDFRDCVADVEIKDIAMTRLRFTWNKQPGKANGLLKKLDRVMSNGSFLSSFPNAYAQFLPFMTSDHSPAIFVILEVDKTKPKPFKFHNFLTRKEGFLPLVTDIWKNDIKGFSMAALIDEESFLRQKSKSIWLKEGDRNSKYFQNVIRGRLNRGRISIVEDMKGRQFVGSEVCNQFVTHFYNVLGKSAGVKHFTDHESLFTNVLSQSKANYMVCDVSHVEIKKALFDIDSNKAPGPDGFSSEFFKAYWNVVGTDLCNAVKEFFKSGKLLKETNATIIALVHKCHTPRMLSDYRPIACCNVIYKIISKVIVNRIKSCLGDLVDQNQSAFIPNRQISDNILLSQELMRGYHTKRGPAKYVFRVDIHKAYDSVEWSFLKTCLKHFGFHDVMIRWIMECSSSFKFHWQCKKLNIINLCFADDLMLFCHGYSGSVAVLKKVLDDFGRCSGLLPSLTKSFVFFGNVSENAKARILNVMPMNVGMLRVRYLGVPLISKRLFSNYCLPLIDKVRQRILDWKNKALSFAGRLQLIQSVVSSMQVYWAFMFILPVSIANDIERLMRDFL